MRMSTLPSVQQALHTTHRDVRVIPGPVHHFQQTVLQRGAGAFVQAILERYTGRQTYWSSLALILRQRVPGMTVHPVYQQVQLHLAPHVRLTIRGESTSMPQRSIARVERTVQEWL